MEEHMGTSKGGGRGAAKFTNHKNGKDRLLQGLENEEPLASYISLPLLIYSDNSEEKVE